MALTTTQGTVLTIDKLEDQKCEFVNFELNESILGKLPTAKVLLRCDHDLVQLKDEVVVTITDPLGNTYSGNMYVYSIKMDGRQHSYTIELLSQNPEFTREPHLSKFTNIKNAVSSLYPGGQVTNTDTDLLNDIEIHQMNETDYNLCTRLLHAWKKNTIFGYCLDGLRILDLNNYQPVSEDDFKFDRDMTIVGGSSDLSDPKLFSKDAEFINPNQDGTQYSDPNHFAVKFDKNYLVVNNDYRDLIGNYLYNKRFEATKWYLNTTTRRELNPLVITSGIKISDDSGVVRFNELFIASRTMKIDLNSINIDYTLRSINP